MFLSENKIKSNEINEMNEYVLPTKITLKFVKTTNHEQWT